jgi:hypothetical protein
MEITARTIKIRPVPKAEVTWEARFLEPDELQTEPDRLHLTGYGPAWPDGWYWVKRDAAGRLVMALVEADP